MIFPKTLLLLFLAFLTTFPLMSSSQTDSGQPVVMSRTVIKVVPLPHFHKTYSIQITARKGTTLSPDYFEGLSTILEGHCKDGWIRYFVGEYDSKTEATNMLGLIRSISPKYMDSFVIRTSDIQLNTSPVTPLDKVPNFDNINKNYAVQIATLRYPVFTSEFVEFPKVVEFYNPQDQTYRYTTKDLNLAEAQVELKRAIENGYLDATIVNPEAYAPYRVE